MLSIILFVFVPKVQNWIDNLRFLLITAWIVAGLWIPNGCPKPDRVQVWVSKIHTRRVSGWVWIVILGSDSGMDGNKTDAWLPIAIPNNLLHRSSVGVSFQLSWGVYHCFLNVCCDIYDVLRPKFCPINRNPDKNFLLCLLCNQTDYMYWVLLVHCHSSQTEMGSSSKDLLHLENKYFVTPSSLGKPLPLTIPFLLIK